jgi:hypothetical protein
VLKPADDAEYINLLKLPKFTLPDPAHERSFNQTTTKNLLNVSHLNDTLNFPNQSIMSPSASILASSSILKRKASTPHPNIKSPNGRKNHPIFKEVDMPEPISGEARTLASSLKNAKPSEAVTGSGSKSVKFKATKFTREIDEDRVVDNEVHDSNVEESLPVSDTTAARKSIEKPTEPSSELTTSSGRTSRRKSKSPVKGSPERKKLTFVENEEASPVATDDEIKEESFVEGTEGDVSMDFDL